MTGFLNELKTLYSKSTEVPIEKESDYIKDKLKEYATNGAVKFVVSYYENSITFSMSDLIKELENEGLQVITKRDERYGFIRLFISGWA